MNGFEVNLSILRRLQSPNYFIDDEITFHLEVIKLHKKRGFGIIETVNQC